MLLCCGRIYTPPPMARPENERLCSGALGAAWRTGMSSRTCAGTPAPLSSHRSPDPGLSMSGQGVGAQLALAECVPLGGRWSRLRVGLNLRCVASRRPTRWLSLHSGSTRRVRRAVTERMGTASRWLRIGHLHGHILDLISAQIRPRVRLRLRNRESEGMILFGYLEPLLLLGRSGGVPRRRAVSCPLPHLPQRSRGTARCAPSESPRARRRQLRPGSPHCRNRAAGCRPPADRLLPGAGAALRRLWFSLGGGS